MTVCPAVTDADDDIGGQQIGIAIAVRGLQTAHACHQAMVVGMTPQPIRVGMTGMPVISAETLAFKKIGRIGIDDATTSDDQRTFRLVKHGERLFSLCRVAAGL